MGRVVRLRGRDKTEYAKAPEATRQGEEEEDEVASIGGDRVWVWARGANTKRAPEKECARPPAASGKAPEKKEREGMG